MTKLVIVVNSSSPVSEPTISLSLQTTGILLGILVSGSVLAGLAFRIISNINRITLSLDQIEKEIKELSSYTERTVQIERRMDLHIQEYVNRKDVIQMVLGQLDEKIDHKFKRLLFYARELQRFLQRDTNFQIREYEESKEGEE